MKKKIVAATAALLVVAMAHAEDKLNIVLNWLPGADHAPLFYAQKMGWFKEAGLDVSIENGKGSMNSLLKVASGDSALGIVDIPTALQGRDKGADVVGVYVIYANSPYGIYWKKSSGIRNVMDLKGKKLGNPPGDAARVMWPAIAKAVGLGPNDVTWVNVAPEGKIAALQSGAIAATTHFYSVHYVYERTFGADLGYVATRDLGFNPYGNAIVANRAYLEKNKAVLAKFVPIVQRAYAACLQNPAPCNEYLAEASSQKLDDVSASWKNVATILVDDTSRKVALGAFDANRMEADYKVTREIFGLKPFDPKIAYTNEFLDKGIKAN
jgi:NitT/TauT family transport system substrate-binding protein